MLAPVVTPQSFMTSLARHGLPLPPPQSSTWTRGPFLRAIHLSVVTLRFSTRRADVGRRFRATWAASGRHGHMNPELLLRSLFRPSASNWSVRPAT
jgi:hypothetical protein